MKSCVADSEEQRLDLADRANQCVEYRESNKIGDYLWSEYYVRQYDLDGCNICTLHPDPDDAWLCTEMACAQNTKEQRGELEWRSNLCVGYEKSSRGC